MATSSSSVRNNHLPPSLVANLQSVLAGRNAGGESPGEENKAEPDEPPTTSSAAAEPVEEGSTPVVPKPVILVTNSEGIGSPGLISLVDALVKDGRFDVHVCAPETDKSSSGHSLTARETVIASSIDISGATGFEVSGSAVDCVSLALSGALFSSSKPALVISGISKGSNCGYRSFYSGTIAAAREALMCGVPSLSISLNWKQDESQNDDLKVAADICLPFIFSVLRGIEDGIHLSGLLSIEVPTSPATNKGFKITRPSAWRPTLNWLAVSGYKNPSAGQFMSKHPSLGIQLAQLSRDASAAGAARRITAQRKTVEIESVAAAGKSETQHGTVKKYFHLEFLEREEHDNTEDVDIKALEDGFVAVTPLYLSSSVEAESSGSMSEWLSSALVVCGKI